MKTLLVFATLLLMPLADAATVKVLILSGQNNHAWKQTTPVIKRFLEESGSIDVRVTEAPQTLASSDFEGIDVILSNWNAFPSKSVKDPVTEWSDETRKAYVDFVRMGGGHVVVHAGSTSFYDWDDYFAICLMRWNLSRTSHGKSHAFPIRIENPEHPVIEGFVSENHYDELWRRVEYHPNAEILASSFSGESDGGTQEWEPCVFVGKFGKGRCFSTTLGHGVESLSDPDLQKLIIQGVLWTAPKMKSTPSIRGKADNPQSPTL